MQLTYNKFKQVVDHSSEKVFDKIAGAISTSDNAAIVAMFDDKLILLDEDKDDLFLCDYLFENSVLTMHKFKQITLSENDDSYLEEVVERYFDLDDDEPVAVGDLMSGFNLKFKNESKSIFTEVKDRKYRKIQESPRIRAIKKARDARNIFAEEIKTLLEEPFIQHLDAKLFNPNAKSTSDSIAPALNKVNFKTPYPIFVNTDIGGPAKDLIQLRDNTNAMDAMKGVALKVSDKWKSDSFRKKFERMINQILATESVELGKTAVLSLLDENKELFLLKDELFEELITKTVLMLGEGNTEDTINVFNKIKDSREARIMRNKFFKDNAIDEEKFEELNVLIENDDSSDDLNLDDEPTKDAGNDLDSEDVDKIIDIFKKIKKSLEDDSPESEYVSGLISALDSAKVSGIEDSKMKEIVDFLSSVETPKKEKKKKEPEEDEEEEEEEEIEL